MRYLATIKDDQILSAIYTEMRTREAQIQDRMKFLELQAKKVQKDYEEIAMSFWAESQARLRTLGVLTGAERDPKLTVTNAEPAQIFYLGEQTHVEEKCECAECRSKNEQ